MKTPLPPWWMVLCLLLLPPAAAQTLHVVPGGGAGGSGGAYPLAKPLTLRSGDASDRPLTLRSEPGNPAVFSLGTPMSLSAFAPVTDAALLARMMPEARGKIVRLDLARHGMVLKAAPDNFGGHEWLEVIHQGARLPLARWPNQGYARLGEVLDKGLPPSKTGGTFRHNFIHHSMNANALYMDDGSCGSLMEGNILWKVQTGAFIGGGHDQTVRHNLLLEYLRALHMDSRGVSRNYSLENHGFADDLRSVPHTEEPWKSRYPELPRILEQDTRLPRNVRMEHNLLAGCALALRKSGRNEHFAGLLFRENEELPSAVAFIDETTMTIRVPENLRAQAAALPWVRTIERAGLIRDDHRTVIPPRDLELLRTADTTRTFDSQTDIDASNRK